MTPKLFHIIAILFAVLALASAQGNTQKFETRFIMDAQAQSQTDLKNKIVDLMNRIFDLQTAIQFNNITINDLAK